MSPRPTRRRFFGLDRPGPPPPETLPGAPLRPWTIPNAIGFVRLALIPVFLWLAWEDGTPIAGSIVLLGNTAHGTRGAIDRERAGPTRASFLLEWLAIEEAVARGCRSYHLGETGTASSLATFKEGFGGRSVPYADFGIERLPVSRADRALRTGVKRVIGFRDGT